VTARYPIPTSPLWTGRLVIATAGICGSALGLALGLVLGLAAGAVVGLPAGVDAGGEVVVLVAVGGEQAAARRTRPPNVAAARHPPLICVGAKGNGVPAQNSVGLVNYFGG
jgi:hypothetical protein